MAKKIMKEKDAKKLRTAIKEAAAEAAALLAKPQGKPSLAPIVDAMLLEGRHERKDIMAAVRHARPDFKDPSALVSSRFRALRQAGKEPGLKDAPRERAFGGAELGRMGAEASAEKRFKRRMDELDDYVRNNDAEVALFSSRVSKLREAAAAEPRHRRVWP